MLRMKFNKTAMIVLLAIIACGIWAAASLGATGPTREELLTRIVMRAMTGGHFSSPEVDDAFVKKAFNLYLKRLDPQKRFLLQSDVDLLAEQIPEIPDQLKMGRYEISDGAHRILQDRIADAQKIVDEILSQPLNLDAADSLVADNDKRPFCKSREELRERWLHLLKFQVLTRLDDAIEESEKKSKDSKAKDAKSKDSNSKDSNSKDSPSKETASDKDAKKTPTLKDGRLLAADELAAREYVRRNVQRIFKRMIKEDRLERVSVWLNALVNVTDPHTEYFKPEAKEEFDLSMTGRLEGIGAVLKEEDGFIKVVSIVPGSASWKQKELKAEDKILKVAQADGEPVDLTDASVNEAVKLIRGKKGTEVRLTVEKTDGQIRTIPIIRDVVIVEETYAKSAVLESEKSDKVKGELPRIGYITLPSFYHDFSNPKARSAAGDVAKEIEKLKAAKVSGIMLDFRNNGEEPWKML